MNVLHIYKTYYPDTQGGLEEAISQICRATAAHGVNSRILTTSRNETDGLGIIERYEAVVYRVPVSFEIASCPVALRALGVIRELFNWADVVQLHYPWPFGDLLLAFCSRPVVISYHSDVVKQRFLDLVYGPLRWLTFSRAKAVVATSPNYLKTSSVLQSYADKATFIPLALDESKYCVPSVFDEKSQYGKDFFFFVGVLRYYKGLEYLLLAFKGLPYKLVIAGDGPERIKLEMLIEQHQLHNVMLIGRIDDSLKNALFKLCSVFVFPSCLRSEAFGVSLLEASYFSKPMITCEIGTGTSYVNKNGVTGLTVPPFDVGALRKAVVALGESKSLREACGMRAKERSQKLFKLDRVGQQYVTLWNRVVRP